MHLIGWSALQIGDVSRLLNLVVVVLTLISDTCQPMWQYVVGTGFFFNHRAQLKSAIHRDSGVK